MNIQNLANLPSDPDVTVILVKKCLQENMLQNKKSGDGQNISASTSLVNFVTHKERSKDDTSSNCSLLPISSWDPGSVGNIASASERPVASSCRIEDIFHVREPSKSLESVVPMKTTEASFTESESSLSSNPNDAPFVDISLQDRVENSQNTAISDNVKCKEKTSPFTACFSCIMRKKKSTSNK
ncbi:hypothetical protein J6590_077531 [Homalodisca vitripennis]|nr:hypothetical protein J6590_077528 [Homalodisca vitripennis]KAG8295551.1 hypothetical protein J6590_077531 [Homalodisca vitripennis]